MVRKTTTASAAAIAAMLIFAVTNAEGSFAQAQEAAASITLPGSQLAGPGEIVPLVTPEADFEAPREAGVPEFVAREMVQDIPETPAEDQNPAQNDALDANLLDTGSLANAGSLRELVAATPTGGELSEQMQCLAGAVYFEARGEPLAGQLAVAKVVMNRSASRSFPNSYCSVVYQRAQFSFVRGGRMPSIKYGSNAWQRAKAIARIAHNDLWDSAAQDSLYFHAKYVRPSWSRKKQQRATISSHIFYR